MSGSLYEDISRDLKLQASPEKKAVLQRFFKTGKGQYGEGDIFLGVTVPKQRKIAGFWYQKVGRDDLHELMTSSIHEHRMTALLMLLKIYQGKRRENMPLSKEECIAFYLEHISWQNNWDLVDTSCIGLLGDWLLERDRGILYTFARSGELWKQRIAVVSSMAFIRKGQFQDTLDIADLLLHHPHDLIHKATGWMLREVGKRSLETETAFLDLRYKQMPRTMLRYAIERFPEDLRRAYLHGER